MAKNRKTKKEKLRSAKRHTAQTTTKPTPEEIPSSPADPTLYTFTAETQPLTSTQQTFVPDQIIHLRQDLFRAMTVTGSIVFAEIILFLILMRM